MSQENIQDETLEVWCIGTNVYAVTAAPYSNTKKMEAVGSPKTVTFNSQTARPQSPGNRNLRSQSLS
jgi:hypothetical protein